MINLKAERAAEREAFRQRQREAEDELYSFGGPEGLKRLEELRKMKAEEEADWNRKYRQERTIHLKGDIIITDPCYLVPLGRDGLQRDWDRCDMGANMEVLGIQNYLVRDTLYGDWSCTTVNADTRRAIGQFCADAGLVGVFLLSEVLAYNPKYDDHIKKPYTCTLIKDFDGDVTIKVVDITFPETDDNDKETGETCLDEEVQVIGQGNINFFTTQTGL